MFEALLPHLDERQQRLVTAGQPRSPGHGGIAAVASPPGASRSRVSLGVAELVAGDAPLGQRPAGARWPQVADRDRSGTPRGAADAGGADPARKYQATAYTRRLVAAVPTPDPLAQRARRPEEPAG